MRKHIALVLTLAAIMGIGLWLIMSGAVLPPWVKFVPGILALLVCWALAAEEWRRATPSPLAASARVPFDLPTRLITAAIGAGLGLSIAIIPSSFAAIAWLGSMAALLAFPVWAFMTQAGTAPAVGLTWGKGAWTAFATGSAAVVVIIGLQLLGVAPLDLFAMITGSAVAAAFVAIAVFGRDHGEDAV